MEIQYKQCEKSIPFFVFSPEQKTVFLFSQSGPVEKGKKLFPFYPHFSAKKVRFWRTVYSIQQYFIVINNSL